MLQMTILDITKGDRIRADYSLPQSTHNLLMNMLATPRCLPAGREAGRDRQATRCGDLPAQEMAQIDYLANLA
jgi:hypothetical protein